MKKIFALFLAFVCVLFFGLTSCNNSNKGEVNQETEQENQYNQAFELIKTKDYEGAYKIFKELGDYKDSKEQLNRFKWGIKKVVCNEDDDVSSLEIFYDGNNLPLRYIETYSDGDKEIYDYTYDANGNVLKVVYTDSDGGRYIYDYTYDTNGNVLKEVFTYSSGNKEICDYTYDTNGNILKEVCTYSDGDKSIYDYVYDYDVNGNIIQKIITSSDERKYIYNYTYDTNGNVIKFVESGSYGDITECDFIYTFIYIPYDLTEEKMEEYYINWENALDEIW